MNRSGNNANKSVAHGSSGPLPLEYLQRYGLAILSVGVALGASLLLEHFHFRVPSSLLLLFAVAISSWYAGAGPAVLAAILSTISFYWYFVEPVHTIYIYWSQIPYFVIFTAFAALLSRFGTFRQRAEADLRRTHNQLEVERPKLGSRTIALLYFAFSSCWILFTDRLVHGLGLSNAYLLKVSEAKGILFISLSTLLMYVLVEKALRQRHSVATAYWQLVETAQEGVWSVDAEGQTVFANENMAAILGTSPGEMIGKSILPFVPQEKKDELLNHLRQREQGLQEHYEFPFLRADGAQVWTLLRVSPVLRDGQHSGYLALVSDITERKRAEEALSRLNRELRAISNCNQTLLRATDEQGLLEEICRIVCEEAGYCMAWVGYAEHDEAKSVRPVAWTGAEEGYLANLGITWADTERGWSPTGTAIRTGKTSCIEDFTTDPRLAPWRESVLQRGFCSGIALPLKDEHAQTFGSLSIYSAQPSAFTPEEIRLLEELAGDLAFGIVTLRSRAARERAEQEVALLSFALDKGHEAAFLINDTAHFDYVNEEACRALGYTRAELLGMGVADIDPEFPVEHWSDHWRNLKAQQSRTFESRHRMRDGRIFPVEISANYLEYGGRAYHMALVRDITERKRAEETLRRSEAYLAEEQRLTHTGCWAWDPRRNTMLHCSEEIFRIYGLEPQDRVPTFEELMQRVHPEDRDWVKERTLAGIREKVEHFLEYRIVLPDGALKYIQSVRCPVLNEAGEVVEVVGTSVDVTEQKQAEQALWESEANLNRAQEIAHIGSWYLDIARNQLTWSNEVYRIFDMPRGTALTYENFLGRIYPEDREHVDRAWVAALQGAPYDIEHRILVGDQLKWVRERAAVEFDPQGKAVRGIGTVQDITERKRAEEEARNTAAQWQATFDAVQDLVLLLDKDFRIVRANRPAAEFMGLPFDKIVGGHCYDLIHGTSTPPTECPLAKMRRSRRHEEVEVLAREGGPWLSVSVDPVFDPSGELTHVVHVARDITERRLAEGELRKHREHLEDLVKQRTGELAEAKARAEAASREKTAFLANMSHELRTPLNAVLGFSRLLKSGSDVTPHQQESLDIIVRSGEHLLNLINNILDMAKIESGRVVLEESEVDLHQLLHEMQSLMGVGAEEKGLHFALESAPDLPRFVAVDAGKLRQVLLNLLSNAIKYTDSGGVTLRAKLTSRDGSERTQVRFEVEDSGPGINQDDCQHIFFPFVQLGGRVPARAGTGLGLAICKQYVELMGGQIGVTSEPGKGSIFSFDTPVRVLPSMAEPEQPKHGRILGLAEGQPSYRLLIVEDQPENRLLLRMLLNPLGFELREAANGQEAVALFEQWHPDLIWMDIRMPVMDGLEAVRRIRASKAGADPKIIALTAHALEEERIPIMATGCDGFVRKPFREQEIFDALTRYLHLKFIYEKAPRPESTQQAQGLTLRSEQLKTLPAELLKDLRQAVVELNTAHTHALIEQITERDAAMGRALNTLATQLDYQGLLKLLEKGHS